MLTIGLARSTLGLSRDRRVCLGHCWTSMRTSRAALIESAHCRLVYCQGGIAGGAPVIVASLLGHLILLVVVILHCHACCPPNPHDAFSCYPWERLHYARLL